MLELPKLPRNKVDFNYETLYTIEINPQIIKDPDDEYFSFECADMIIDVQIPLGSNHWYDDDLIIVE